jgi:hypothetical protein
VGSHVDTDHGVPLRGAGGGPVKGRDDGEDDETADDEDVEGHGATALELNKPERLTRALWRVRHIEEGVNRILDCLLSV